MNIADLIILVIWCFFAASGYGRGFVREAATFFGLIAAINFADVYHGDLAPHLTDIMATPQYTSLAAYIIILVGVIVIIRILVTWLTNMIKLTMVQWANNFFGLLFGLGKGILLTAVAMMVINAYNPRPDFAQNSKFIPYVTMVSRLLMDYAPREMQQKIKDYQVPGGVRK